jgi:hypothetical protein
MDCIWPDGFEASDGHVSNVEHVSNVLNPQAWRIAASRCEARVPAEVQGSSPFHKVEDGSAPT